MPNYAENTMQFTFKSTWTTNHAKYWLLKICYEMQYHKCENYNWMLLIDELLLHTQPFVLCTDLLAMNVVHALLDIENSIISRLI